MSFLIIVYNLFGVPLFYIGLKIAGLFHEKIRQTAQGRKGLFPQLIHNLEKLKGKKKIWIHISSMGEYEQGKPVIDEFISRYPDYGVVVSVFSPSGFHHIKLDHPNVVVTWLPFDYFQHASRFITLVNPEFTIVVRHDFWLNYQYILQKRQIPSFLIDASLSNKRLNSARRFWFFFGPVYKTFSAIFTVSPQQAERFQTLLPDMTIISTGDTRYDRVYARATETEKIADLIKRGDFTPEKCMVIGSSWPSDEKVILPVLERILEKELEFKLIVAPHETTPAHLQQIQDYFQEKSYPLVRLADFDNWNSQSRILLIDRIGLLANLYALGKIAYVGGGFGPGVHNVLEPAAHGAAVFFGPRHLNSPEAKEMTEQNIGIPVNDEKEFNEKLHALLLNREFLNTKTKATHDFVMKNIGASEKTIQHIIECVEH